MLNLTHLQRLHEAVDQVERRALKGDCFEQLFLDLRQGRVVGRVSRRREKLRSSSSVCAAIRLRAIGETKYDICCSVMLASGELLLIESPPDPVATPFSKTARAYCLKSGGLFAIVPSF